MLVNARLMESAGGMDEDFFLYHEEVAFSRVAHQRGWRVEFDPNVRVVHRHPLQNRAISPKMRVITRHSKLLYFRKHLPRWQFHALAAIVRLESAVRGRWSAVRGRRDEARAWAGVAEIEWRLRRGDAVRGRDVLALAEAMERPEAPSCSAGDAERTREPRHLVGSPGRTRRPARMKRRAGRPDAMPLAPGKDGPA